MENNSLTTWVELIDDKVGFSGTARTNPEIKMDYFPPFGYGNGYTGLEMLLLSFSCCSGTALSTLIRRMGKTISGMKITATGERQTTPPLAFSHISINFELHSPDAGAEDVRKSLELAETSVCPVWAMIKGNTEIIPTFSIVSGS